MCKLFMMTNMQKVGVTARLVKAVRDEVCRHSDKDGFGYGVLGSDGSLGGERTMRPFRFDPGMTVRPDSHTRKLPIIQHVEGHFGSIDFQNPKAFVAHGRFSTNSISLPNTHPFNSDDNKLSLFHNGVVQDQSGEVRNETSTCDTELLLRHWERGGMADIEKHVTGYYALGVLDARNRVLHVVRDSVASLYIAYSRSAQSYLIATTTEIILGVAKTMKWKVDRPEELLPNLHVVFSGNEILSQLEITPRGRTSAGLSYIEARSLGQYVDEYADETVQYGDDTPPPAYREDAGQDEDDVEDPKPVDKFMLGDTA